MTAILQSACTPKSHTRSPLKTLLTLLDIHRQRRQLASLDADALRDIGLCRAAVDEEIQKPFWDVPGYWLK